MWFELQKELQQLPNEQSSAAIHDVRVAARRLRALLRSLRSEANPSAYAQLRFDLTNLGREFADVRSADIYERLTENFLADCPDANLKDRASLEGLLGRITTSTRKSLAWRMQEDYWEQRSLRIDRSVRDDGLLLRSVRPVNGEYLSILRDSIAQSVHALRKRKCAVQTLHKQRIRIKSTRYVCEALAPLLGLDVRRAAASLSKAQDLLGELHDSSALIAWLESAPVPQPLLKQLAAAAHSNATANRKRFLRSRPELRKRLRKLAKSLRVSA